MTQTQAKAEALLRKVRERLSEVLLAMISRPGMYAIDPHGVGAVLYQQLHVMCLVHDREESFSLAIERLRASKVWRGAVGEVGWLMWALKRDDCIDEVASTYARLAHLLGFLPLDRRYADPRAIAKDIRADDTPASLTERFGEPSLLVGTQVMVYAHEDDEGPWAYVDWDGPLRTVRYGMSTPWSEKVIRFAT